MDMKLNQGDKVRLCMACEAGDMQIIKDLLDTAATDEFSREDRIVFMVAAASFGHLDIFQMLELVWKDHLDNWEHCHQILFAAFDSKSEDMVLYIINRVEDGPWAYWETVLTNAINARMNMVILHAAPKIKSYNDEGRLYACGLLMAIRLDYDDVVKTIISCGACVNQKDGDFRYPIHHAATRSVKVMKALLDKGAWPDMRTRDRKTTLDIAIDCKNVDMVAFLKSLDRSSSFSDPFYSKRK